MAYHRRKDAGIGLRVLFDELLPLVAIDDAALLPPNSLELVARAFSPRDVALPEHLRGASRLASNSKKRPPQHLKTPRAHALDKIRNPTPVDAVALVVLVDLVREPPDAVDI